jgi:transcriptional activator of cad operon
MERPSSGMLRIGDWRVNPNSGEISRNGETVRLEARTLRLLLLLAGQQGEVVSIDELLDHVWPGVAVSPDSVYQAIAALRRQLGDDPKQPAYIATIPRLGYRLVAQVSSDAVTIDAPALTRAPTLWNTVAGSRWRLAWIGVLGLCIAFGAALLIFNRRHAASTAGDASIAVLPFLDLTEKMAQEEFADGMTEELIDRLSKIPSLRVPAPTASFYFKNKHVPLPEIAAKLGVVYVLDGSTRKSGDRLRVAARLVRADRGFVMWTETYDRAWGDSLSVQDDIASQVTKALRTAIGH